MAYTKFTPEMKKTHTILVPNMLPIHFHLIIKILEQFGYHMELLESTSRTVVEEGLKNTEAFVALTGNSETNILACLAAKRMGVSKTVAEVENIDYIGMAESLDIGTVINKKMIAASHIYQMMLDADVS